MKQNYFVWEVPLLSCEQEKFPCQPQGLEIESHICLGSGHKPAVKLHVCSSHFIWLQKAVMVELHLQQEWQGISDTR